MNPASALRRPKYVVKKGKTPVLDTEHAGQLLSSIDASDLIGLRDRALIGVMVYTAPICASFSINRSDVLNASASLPQLSNCNARLSSQIADSRSESARCGR